MRSWPSKIVESLSAIALVTDADGRVIYANPAAARLSGHSRRQLRELALDQLFSLTPEQRAQLDGSIRNGDSARFEVSAHRRDGSTFPVELRVSPLRGAAEAGGMVVIAADITARKRVEDTLRESERKFTDIAENAMEWIWEVDADGQYTYAGPAVEKILGYTPEEVLKKHFYDLFHPEDRSETKKAAFETFARGQAFREFINRNVHKNGKTVWLSTSGVPIFDDKGNLLGYRGVDIDITERKRAEEEKERLETQLRQAQKMEAIGQLAGGIAHDFNNILTSILGNVELMQAELRSELPREEVLLTGLEQIDRSGQRAAALTRQLLTFSRDQLVKPELLDLNWILRDMEEMARRLIGEHISLELSLAPDLKRIRADAGQLEQVIMNLLVNARDAMPGGGRLTVNSANVLLDEAYTAAHPGASAGPYVLLAVSDTGCGMDAHTQERIFEPFFTTKPLGHGTGLGLSTVYGIVKQASGYVAVESEPGRGTTFKVYLPAVDAPAVTPARHPAVRKTPGGHETALVCEGEESVRTLACRILESAGYAVFSAENGTRALKVAEGCGGPIHLLIADVIMPDMNGEKLARALRSKRPDTKVLYVSGYASNVLARHGMLEEGVSLLEKPFSLRSLLESVREVLDGGKC